ncbi:MAG: NAD(+)/NADH kinase [Deltaproteobacteria bacterium]
MGILVRPGREAVDRRARRLASWLVRRGLRVLAHEDWATSAGSYELATRKQMMARADLVVVLGGDGSLLGAARLSGARSVPVVGINHGEFGFLTISDSQGLYVTVERVLAGDCEIEHRSMLSVRVVRGGKTVARSQALNDAVVTRATFSRMLTLQASVDGRHLTSYVGDGLIVSTPTGSTAYSLSAGGPIVEPTLGAMIMTPISAHTLTTRPLLLSDRSHLTVHVEASCDEAVLTLDGQEGFELYGGDRVEITRARNRAAIVTARAGGFFSILRRKMNWGARG